LPTKQFFLKSIPKPVWYFGRQMIFLLDNQYFFLLPSDYQKNLDRKKSKRFRTPLEISRNKSINIVKLVNTELIRTSRSPYESSLPGQHPSFEIKWLSTVFHQNFEISYNEWVHQGKVGIIRRAAWQSPWAWRRWWNLLARSAEQYLGRSMQNACCVGILLYRKNF
jgi:hypothetical protein